METNKNNTDLKKVLNFLQDIAKSDDTNNPMHTIIEFINTDGPKELMDSLVDKLNAEEAPDYYKYFLNEDGLAELKTLYEEDPDKYFCIIHYENILLNLICSILDMPYTIVLTPADLSKSYYLRIKLE